MDIVDRDQRCERRQVLAFESGRQRHCDVFLRSRAIRWKVRFVAMIARPYVALPRKMG